MDELAGWTLQYHLKQAEAAAILMVSRPRVPDGVKRKTAGVVFRPDRHLWTPDKGLWQGAARRQCWRPWQELQRRRKPFSGFPQGEPPRGHLPCCVALTWAHHACGHAPRSWPLGDSL